ncbi:hypothetical protein HPP92_006531, partial [Vanilla planifolia]
MLSKFSIIVSLSTVEAIRFQLLNASPFIINFAGDLKYAVGSLPLDEREKKSIADLKLQLNERPVWMAASIHRSEVEVMMSVHRELKLVFLTCLILVLRHPLHGRLLSQALQRGGFHVALRSRNDVISSSIDIYVADTLGELGMLYRVTPIAVIGGSFQVDLAGHNFSEAAAAGCAVLVGHFSRMLAEMKQVDSLSVLQVEGEVELLKALMQLLSNIDLLEAHRKSAKSAFSAVSKGVVHRAWNH